MNPDDEPVFRCARLLLLLDLVRERTANGVDVERLGIYDFFAAHPLLLVAEPADPDRTTLRLAGFDDRAIAYTGAGQRLVTTQQRLPADLTALISSGLVEMIVDGRVRYRLTEPGQQAAARLTAAYAHSYRLAARIVLKRLRRLSARKLRQTVRSRTAALPDRPFPFSPSKDPT
ncbi:hypothetical protein [Cryptosporangium phraense]|uniref:hypothetical protein n=1 Tax=Cryptosporangium phraense TaxID=2593070 RepID=UPI00197AD5E7|nr:hypothetical protein [Cryptosporangium phraense]